MRRSWVLWLFGSLAVVVGLAYAVAFLIDEPLRQHMERNINTRLTGYTVRIGKLDLHPLDFSLDLKDLTIVQNAHPRPPVARIHGLSASVQWRALLDGRLVGDMVLDHPTVIINLRQAKAEIADKVPLSQRGWQRALEAIYPLKINEFRVVEGDVTYVDQGPFRPLYIRRLNLRADNIRNIRSPDRTYPSDLHLEGVVFDTGRLAVDGRADFLAEPHPGVRANVELEEIELDYFKPITNRYNVSVNRGTLSARGRFEYAPSYKEVRLRKAVVEGIQVAYVHKVETAAAEAETAKQVARAARQVSNDPGIRLRVDQLDIVNSTFTFENRAKAPAYRVFLTEADMTLTNLSNQGAEGTAIAKVKGRFMGTGRTAANVAFRPEQRGPDLDLNLRIENAEMPAMNDLLRAFGDFDVVRGKFSLYSELSIRNGFVNGYLKPLFKDMEVYDSDQDRDKPLSRKMYEALIGGLAKLLKNRQRGEVATKAVISGPTDSPEVSTWEVVRRLIQNAFFKAILPGFESEDHRPAGSPEANPPPRNTTSSGR